MLSGSDLSRLPVAANTAFAIAGAIGGTPGSPSPPSAAPERMNSTVMLGASASFGIGRSLKLRLRDAAVVDRHLVEQRGRNTEDDAAFDLRLRRVRIDDVAAIDGRAHAMHFDAPLDDSTSATSATIEPKLSTSAMPRPRPAAGGVLQPAIAAAFSSTAR